MPQRLNYAALPNTPDKAYLAVINKVIGHVGRTPAPFKVFREWLREQQLWERDQAPIALELMGVQTKPEVGLTELGVALLNAKDEMAQKRALFRGFRDRNPLLAKFVLEALDPDSGGRLHSTYELHRMLTSYVYPGKHISLPDFQAWVKWMTAADALRLIGIRWGLGDVGKENLEWFKARDADEILEDDEDGDEGAEEAVVVPAGGQAAPPSLPAPLGAKPVAAGRSAAPARKAGATNAPSPAVDDVGADEDLPDMPPEAPTHADDSLDEVLDRLAPPPPASPASPAAAAAAAARAARPSAIGEALAVAHPQLAAPRTQAFGVGAPRIVAWPVDESALHHTAQWVREWWAGWPERRTATLADFGLQPQSAATPAGLGAAALAAIVATSGVDETRAAAWFGGVVRSAPLLSYFGGECSLDALVDAAGIWEGDEAHRVMGELIIHAAPLRARISRQPELVAIGPKAQDGRALAEFLFRELFGEKHALAVFWLIRELHLAGAWTASGLAEAAAVPTYAVREHAYRLGFIQSLYAESFEVLANISGALSRHFGPDEGFGAALGHLQSKLGCAFRCAHVHGCPLACREKLGR